MNEELLPCPFCGGEPFKYDLENDPQFGTVKVIRCKNIPCQAAIMCKDDSENIAAWNRRVSSERDVLVGEVVKAATKQVGSCPVDDGFWQNGPHKDLRTSIAAIQAHDARTKA